MKKLIPAAFVVIGAALFCFFVIKQLVIKNEGSASAKEVVPQVEHLKEDDKAGQYGDNNDFSSFISLTKEETLLSVVTMDLDGDGNEDQINVCKVANNPYIQLIAGLYNPEKAVYERQAYLATNVTQVQTFACTSLDVIGNHHSALIYQGDSESGHAVLRIFLGGRDKKGKFTLKMIGDFDADGRVFIQQSERSEAYEMGQAKGVSFPVWVYASDTDENRRLDQIQTQYEYSEEEGKYIETKTIRVAGSRITAKELARIQDGTVGTFANFLDGLWYKTETEGGGRYIFFDYKNKEIIFQFEDSVEVYNWLKSNLRRNGMYFSSVNKTIQNLQRRFDISLVNVNEIRIRIQDDVRMIIGESNLWDGSYKKIKTAADVKKASSGEIFAELVKGPVWSTADGTSITFTASGYFVENERSSDTGRYVVQKMNGGEIMQFRSESGTPYFSGFYEPKFVVNETVRTVRNKPVKTSETDKNTVILQSVVANPDGYYQTESMPLVLHRSQIKKTVKE